VDASDERRERENEKRIGLFFVAERRMSFRQRVYGRGRGADVPANGKQTSSGMGDDGHEVEGADEVELCDLIMRCLVSKQKSRRVKKRAGKRQGSGCQNRAGHDARRVISPFGR
jgi:hypothetical protein